MAQRRFQPADIIRSLVAHEVDFVLIGGLAATAHGSPFLTLDVDITPNPAADNLGRLSDALRELDARVRTQAEPEGQPFDHDSGSLAASRVWNLVTRFGDLDIAFEPSGTTGHADLARRAVTSEAFGVSIRVAALEDIVRSKEAADRDKDRLVLPTLREILANRDLDAT